MAGTPIYAAINAHLATGIVIIEIIWIDCSKKDDLESLMYVLIQLSKGYLPW
jgi:hypothetical protein